MVKLVIIAVFVVLTYISYRQKKETDKLVDQMVALYFKEQKGESYENF